MLLRSQPDGGRAAQSGVPAITTSASQPPPACRVASARSWSRTPEYGPQGWMSRMQPCWMASRFGRRVRARLDVAPVQREAVDRRVHAAQRPAPAGERLRDRPAGGDEVRVRLGDPDAQAPAAPLELLPQRGRGLGRRRRGRRRRRRLGRGRGRLGARRLRGGLLVAAGADQRDGAGGGQQDERYDGERALHSGGGRRDGRAAQTADTSSSSATRKEEPQPQAAITLGLSTLKPAPWRPST